MLPTNLQKLIETLPPETQALFTAVVGFYEDKIEKLEARLTDLENQLSKDSTNSSKPPSTDGFKKVKKTKSLRSKSKRQPGGQKGHKGDTLKLVAQPNFRQKHQVTICTCCHKDLSNQFPDKIESRQVYDIPIIELKVTEHQSEVKSCSCGKVNKAFPQGVNRYVQYGPNIKGMIVYLQDYQLLPFERTQELIQDFFNHKLSCGTLYNIGETAYGKLNGFKDRIKELLTYCEVVGFDETGCKVSGKGLWLHSCSTNLYTYYEVHPKRGKEAMDGIHILPDFSGIAVHDFWKSYLSYSCEHAICNAHLLRELIFIKERFEQPWAQELIALLLKMKRNKETALAQGKEKFCQQTIKKYQKQYHQIIEKGFKVNPFIPPKEKVKGPDKKTTPRNLLERLRKFQEDILRFIQNFKVPFDNNFSERDIRMMKVKQKISGGFRSLKGAKFFSRIRSYIMTARKQEVNPLQALTNLFTENTIGNQLTRQLDLIYAE